MDLQALIKALNEAIPEKKKVEKGYVNPFAAQLLSRAGYQVKAQDGTVWKAETDTNYGFADFTRARHFQGLQAKEQLMLINDESWFLNRYTKLSGDSNIIPIDYWTGIPEQLVDTQRITSTPQDNSTVVANRNNWAAMFGDEAYVHHLERQVDLPIEVIRQYLYDPDFEARIEKVFAGEIANDLTRLAVNGTDITFANQNFYKLLKSFFVLLKESKGTKTLVSGTSRFVGTFGKKITPVKIDAPSIRFITPLNDTFASDTTAKYVMSAGSVALSAAKMVLTASGTASTMQHSEIIPVLANTNYTFSAWISKAADNLTGAVVLSVLDASGNTIATGVSYTVLDAGGTTAITFNTYDNLGIRIKMSLTHTTGKLMTFDNIKVDRSVKKFQFFDIMNILDVMVDNHSPEYELNEGGYEFIMSKEDAALFAKGLRLPLYIAENGQVMPMATETRENRMQDAQASLQHRGYPIIVSPYAKSLNNGGYIIFGPDKEEFRVVFQNIFSFNRKYEERMSRGGEGYKYTYHIYQSFFVRNPGKFVIAEGIGSTLKCEDIIFSSELNNCGVRNGSSASVVTADISSLADLGITKQYAFCDTPGSVLYYSTTSTDLDSYAAAVAGATRAEGVDFIALGADDYYIRAFLDEVCQPSTKMTLTVQS